MPPRWTIDAVHGAKVRCVISGMYPSDPVAYARIVFLEDCEPMVKRNNLPSCFYSIIERGWA